MALQISCKVVAAADGKELVQHGSTLFPIACYAEDLAVDSVSWHWHEDYEFVLATRGVVYVDINKTRLRLTEGEGVFINSGALHTV